MPLWLFYKFILPFFGEHVILCTIIGHYVLNAWGYFCSKLSLTLWWYINFYFFGKIAINIYIKDCQWKRMDLGYQTSMNFFFVF